MPGVVIPSAFPAAVIESKLARTLPVSKQSCSTLRFSFWLWWQGVAELLYPQKKPTEDPYRRWQTPPMSLALRVPPRAADASEIESKLARTSPVFKSSCSIGLLSLIILPFVLDILQLVVFDSTTVKQNLVLFLLRIKRMILPSSHSSLVPGSSMRSRLPITASDGLWVRGACDNSNSSPCRNHFHGNKDRS